MIYKYIFFIFRAEDLLVQIKTTFGAQNCYLLSIFTGNTILTASPTGITTITPTTTMNGYLSDSHSVNNTHPLAAMPVNSEPIPCKLDVNAFPNTIIQASSVPPSSMSSTTYEPQQSDPWLYHLLPHGLKLPNFVSSQNPIDAGHQPNQPHSTYLSDSSACATECNSSIMTITNTGMKMICKTVLGDLIIIIFLHSYKHENCYMAVKQVPIIYLPMYCCFYCVVVIRNGNRFIYLSIYLSPSFFQIQMKPVM